MVPGEHVSSPLRISPKTLAWNPSNVPFLAGQPLPSDKQPMPSLRCPHETGETPWFHSRASLLLHPSFPPCLVSFMAWREPCSWPRLYLFCCFLNLNSDRPPQKDSVFGLKPVSGRSRILAARPFRGSRLIATPPPFLGSLILLAVADFYILVLAGFRSYS